MNTDKIKTDQEIWDEYLESKKIPLMEDIKNQCADFIKKFKDPIITDPKKYMNGISKGELFI